MSVDISCCINCVYARWQRTATGRVSKKLPGRCTWTATINVPQSYWNVKSNKPMEVKPTSAIWTTEGQGCLVFEAHK